MRRILIPVILASFLVAGCTSLRIPGARPILMEDGPRTGDSMLGTPIHASSSDCTAYTNNEAKLEISLEKRFVKATCLAAKNGNIQSYQTQMLRAGFALTQARCNDFFVLMGNQQTGVRTGKSLIAPLTTLLTGIVALKDFTDPDDQQDFIELIGITSAVGLAGLEIFEQQFLFGAENIDSVRGLVNDALSKEREDIVTNKMPSSYEGVTLQLLSHQMVCSPQHILSLTQDAIKEGTVEVATSSGPALTVDQEALDKMGKALDEEIGTVSLSEASLLYLLATRFDEPDENDNLDISPVRSALAQLNDYGLFDEDGKVTEAFKGKAPSIRSAYAELTHNTKLQVRNQMLSTFGGLKKKVVQDENGEQVTDTGVEQPTINASVAEENAVPINTNEMRTDRAKVTRQNRPD